MGIYRDKDLADTHKEIIDVGDQCFYCGEALTLPAVFWNGFPHENNGSGYLWLHPKCATRLCLKLLDDADKI